MVGEGGITRLLDASTPTPHIRYQGLVYFLFHVMYNNLY